jgi:hypothetical protein
MRERSRQTPHTYTMKTRSNFVLDSYLTSVLDLSIFAVEAEQNVRLSCTHTANAHTLPISVKVPGHQRTHHNGCMEPHRTPPKGNRSLMDIQANHVLNPQDTSLALPFYSTSVLEIRVSVSSHMGACANVATPCQS